MTRRPLCCIAAPANREVDNFGGCSLIELSERGGEHALSLAQLTLKHGELTIVNGARLLDEPHPELGDGGEQLVLEVCEMPLEPSFPSTPILFPCIRLSDAHGRFPSTMRINSLTTKSRSPSQRSCSNSSATFSWA